MLKSLLGLPLLFSPLLMKTESTNKNPSFLIAANERGNYTITGVMNSALDKEELKIYYDETILIDEVSDDAFVNCTNLKTLVLSYSITHISSAALIDSIETVKYTGSIEEYEELGIDKAGVEVIDYASDEGFINFWNKYIRPNEDSNICSITTAIFKQADAKYSELLYSELEIVNATTDKANEKIGLSMIALKNYFSATPQPSNRGTTWNQKGAISFIVVVAVIGMTSICVFYLMKTKRIID